MPAMSTTTGDGVTGVPVDDALGTTTAAAGTAFFTAVPPHATLRTRAGFVYTAGGTAHTVTCLTVVDTVTVASEAAAGQATVSLNRMPKDTTGNDPTGGDLWVLQYEDGDWNAHNTSSISGTTLTVAANLSKKVLKNTKAYFMGGAADHAKRQYTVVPNQTLVVGHAVTGNKVGEPVAFYSNNLTAQGWLQNVSYAYVAAA